VGRLFINLLSVSEMSKIAFIFPGQGSQSVGMLSELSSKYPQIQTTFAQASEVLGLDLWGLTQSGPEAQLNQTAFTQPAILTASIALWRLNAEKKWADVAVMAGHSLGEYSALVASSAIDFQAAVALVHLRGTLMQDAVPAGAGAMACVLGLSNEAVLQACKDASSSGVVACANYNTKGQVVISGEKQAVAAAGELAKKAGAKRVLLLNVSVPSHSPLMKPAAEKLASALDKIDIKTPSIPVIHNVDVMAHQSPEKIRTALIEQLYSPLRWVESVEALSEQGINYFVECGPGKVLTNMGKRIVREATHQSFLNYEEQSCH
jgi:[acyl-carrier-protein] S-malonyltransferase